jgi:glycosyltransferase involved in cell wall biosynthesis
MMSGQLLVSVLVHTKNSQRTIREHLESIRNQSYRSIEIIVVDNNSTDDTIKIAKEFTNKIYNFGPERSAQRNFGAKQAKGEYLYVPDSDMTLGRKIIEKCISFIISNPEVRGIVIPEKSIGEGFWTECKILERSFYIGVSWMEGARFFDKKTFEKLGGYDEENTGTEDFDFPQRLVRKYGIKSIGRISEFILHDEGKISLLRQLKKKYYYAQKLHVYKRHNLESFKDQADLLKRYSLFFSKPKKLFKKPIIGVGLIFMKALEFGAGGLGYLKGKYFN